MVGGHVSSGSIGGGLVGGCNVASGCVSGRLVGGCDVSSLVASWVACCVLLGVDWASGVG